MKILRNSLCATLLFITPFLSPGFLSAQLLEIPSSFNPVGSGARALGMGGAFIAIADDATAASWNPGGLTQLETPEISVVGSAFYREEDLFFGTNPESSGKQDVSQRDVNYFSVVYPFQVKGYNMVVSLNHQHLYDLTRMWEFPMTFSTDAADGDQNIVSDQSGALSALGLAYCLQLTPDLSVGATLNKWTNIFGRNGWGFQFSQKEQLTLNGVGISIDINSEEDVSFSGYNANLGLLWRPNSKLTVGAVYKTSFDADLNYHFNYTNSTTIEGGDPYVITDPIDEDRELTMPRSYGIGFAYRFSDNLTTSFDLYKTEWQNFILRLPNGQESSPLSLSTTIDVDPTYQVRGGAEYLIITDKYAIPVRGGLFYDPAAAEGSPDNYFGFSLGTGIAYKSLAFDLAYQFRFGNDVGSSLMQGYGFSQDTQEHTFYISSIFHF